MTPTEQQSKLFTGDKTQIGQVFGVKIGSSWGRGMFQGVRTIQLYAGLGKRREAKRYQFKNLRTGRVIELKSKLKIAGRIVEAE